MSDLAARRVELDSFDVVEGLIIGKTDTAPAVDVEVLNVVSLRGGLVGSWPGGVVTAKIAVDSAVEHWRAFGLPGYAQFDGSTELAEVNGTIFQGPHQWPDTFGRVTRMTRMCLGLGVVPVFALFEPEPQSRRPPREMGFQASIENYNGRWQAKVWARFRHDSLAALVDRSDRFVAAARLSSPKSARLRSAARIESAPNRRPFPADWDMPGALRKPLAGRVVFLRRSNDKGQVEVLGHTFDVDALWASRLVRADIDLTAEQIRFYALRRRDPGNHRLLLTTQYTPPKRPFKD